MAHPVTPPPGNWLAESAPPDTCTEPEGWAGLPADLLYRVSALLDSQYDLPCLLATCRSWHCTLKSALVALRIHCLGAPALGTNFSSVRSLDAPLRRRTFFGLTYLAPIGNAEMLSARFPSLVHLNLSGQDFGPHGLSVLRPLAGRLQHLDCSGCEFNRADIAALAHLYQLTSLALNAVRAAPVDQETHPEDLLAKDFVFDVVPRLSQLRHLGLRQGAELFRKPADLAKHYDTVQQVQQQAMQAGEFALQAADLQRLADALSKSRRRFLGLPMRKLVDCLTVLRDLSSLDLSQQYLDTTDLTALASLTRLTALAMTWPFLPAPLPMRSGPWPPKPDSAVVWASLFGGPLGQSLRVLDVDLDNRDEYDRLSLATLRNLRVLRLRNCNTAHLLISLMRPTTGPAAAAALPQPGPAGSHGGGGGRGAGAGGGGGGGGRGGGGGGDAVGLVRLELLKAGKRITPALVAQVCSRLPELRTLNVSDSFKLPARFQLHGDLLIRDLAVLCPWLVQLGLRGVALHGVGFPDGRDLALLPFSGPETTEPRNRTATATAAAPTGSAVGASRSGSAAARAAAAAGAGAGASSSSSMSSSSPSPELVQLPFPRLRSLVVQGGPVVAQGAVVIQGGPVFLKSRFRSLANLRALRHLRIEGMTERDFLATCKMGCYEHLSRLTALTALHIMAPPPPGPPEPLPWQQHQAPAAAAAAAAVPPPPPPAAAAGPAPGAAAAGGGGGGVAAGRAASSPPRPEPHLNFITQLTTLRVLTLESMATRGRVFSYLSQLPHLRALSLGGCIDWSEDGLGCLRLSYMPQLRSLRMLGCVWQGGDAWRLVSCLPGTTPSLEELELGACPGVTVHRLASLLGPPPSTSAFAAAAGAGGAAAGSRGRFMGQSSGLPRLRYMRLYGAPIDPEAVQQQQAGLAAGSLRMLDLVTPAATPGGGSFCLVRCGAGFQVVTPEVEAGAGGGAPWPQDSGGDGGGGDEEAAEDRDWDLRGLPVWPDNGDALF